MNYSSGAKHLLHEMMLWLTVAALGFGVVYYFDDMRSFAAKAMAKTFSNVKIVLNEPAAEPRSSTTGFERSVMLKADRNGHFYARAYINGRPISVMVDTGATRIAITYEDAELLGLRPHPSDYTLTTRTANGTGRVAPVTLDSVTIGDVEITRLNGLVAEPGKLHVTLLGMEFIRRLERFELRGRELLLVE